MTDERHPPKNPDVVVVEFPPKKVVPFAVRGNGAAPPARWPVHAEWEPEDIDERNWLIDGLIPEVGLGILAGQSGLGKSHMLTELARSVTTAEDFAGRAVMRPGGVIMLPYEGQQDAHAQWKSLRHARINPWLIETGRPADTKLALIWAMEMPRLTDPGALLALKEIYQNAVAKLAPYDIKPSLLAIDTFMSATDLKDANDAAEAQKVLNMLLQFAHEMNVFVLAVDHEGKDPTRGVRGTSAKHAGVDVVLSIRGTIEEGKPPSDLRLILSKLRGGGSWTVPFHLQQFDMPTTRGVQSEVMIVFDQERPVRPAHNNIGRRLLFDAMHEALDEHGQNGTPLAGMPVVKYVESAKVWDRFRVSYPPTAQGEKQEESSMRKSFDRAMSDSKLRNLIGSHRYDGKRNLVWFVKTDSNGQQ
jgi:hypothetical protein